MRIQEVNIGFLNDTSLTLLSLKSVLTIFLVDTITSRNYTSLIIIVFCCFLAVAPHAFKTTYDGHPVINPKEVEQNLSCYGLQGADNSTEQDITLKDNDDDISIDLLSSQSGHQSCDGAHSSSPTSQCTVVFQTSTSENCYTPTTTSCNTTLFSYDSPAHSLSDLTCNYITSSDDDGYFCSNYDADDEDLNSYRNSPKNNRKLSLDQLDGDEENNNDVIQHEQQRQQEQRQQQEQRPRQHSDIFDIDDDEELFCFRRKTDLSIHTLQDTIQILQSRPKLTDRLYCCQEDSDDCFRESEYDVIDTDDDDIDIVEVINDTTNNPETSRFEIKVRAHTMSSEEGRLIEVKTTPVRDKNKLKIGKVRSLPGIRFPIRNNRRSTSKYYRSTSEISLVSPSSKRQKEAEEEDKLLLDTVYDELVLQSDYLSSRISNNANSAATTPGKSSRRSESDGQQGLTSDADYLTTIHLTCTSGCDTNTNIDTQAEDIPPTKFLSASSFLAPSNKVNKKKRKAVQRLDFSLVPRPCDNSSNIKDSVNTVLLGETATNSSSPQTGRFQVTTVDEVSTPDCLLELNYNMNSTKECNSNANNQDAITLSILNSYEII